MGGQLPLLSGAGQKLVLQACSTGGFWWSGQLAAGRPCCTQWTERVCTPPPQVTVHCIRGQEEGVSSTQREGACGGQRCPIEGISTLHAKPGRPVDEARSGQSLACMLTSRRTCSRRDLIRRGSAANVLSLALECVSS